jgi:hypothetical protein
MNSVDLEALCGGELQFRICKNFESLRLNSLTRHNARIIGAGLAFVNLKYYNPRTAIPD